MEEKPKDEPAFPRDHRHDGHNGISTRQYAAIKLKVPDSGVEWLDDMIRRSLRDELAAKAMQGEVSACTEKRAVPEEVAKFAYEVADAMIKTRGGA